MNQKIEQALEESFTRKQGCRHYWVIEPVQGPISRGVCRLCGEEKEFNNIFTATWFDDEEDIPAFMQRDLAFSAEDDALDKP